MNVYWLDNQHKKWIINKQVWVSLRPPQFIIIIIIIYYYLYFLLRRKVYLEPNITEKEKRQFRQFPKSCDIDK